MALSFHPRSFRGSVVDPPFLTSLRETALPLKDRGNQPRAVNDASGRRGFSSPPFLSPPGWAAN